MGDGSRVWERAIVEHNVAATSRIYDNIYFTELGQILGVDEAKAETIAARMITESRLKVLGPYLPAFPFLFYQL